jgi:hypothetical protein
MMNDLPGTIAADHSASSNQNTFLLERLSGGTEENETCQEKEVSWK